MGKYTLLILTILSYAACGSQDAVDATAGLYVEYRTYCEFPGGTANYPSYIGVTVSNKPNKM